ncbi:MAG: Tetraacyldisaccharide 4'-kinase [Elusimicrobia bacterium]|nr:Tetraacyldisaccharide 4'-kinase [Elusimicrobiota bacterium]
MVSIGNLTWGGTGKTPILIYMARGLKERGVQPAILTRGYGVDEVTLMKEKCPGVCLGVGPQRLKSAEQLLKTNSLDVFLLDDGFQHWRLRRNLDIVCIDATSHLEDDCLLPAGSLREPLAALARADLIVITRSHLVSSMDLEKLRALIHSKNPSSPILTGQFKSQLRQMKGSHIVPWNFIKGKRVVALSAIGNPDAFEKELAMEGAQIVPLRYRDHFNYQPHDAEKIKNAVEKLGGLLVTTEKDWVKLKQWDLDALVVEQTFSFQEKDESKFWEVLKRVIS